MPKILDNKEWKNRLMEAYRFHEGNKKEILSKIEKKLKEINVFELLCHISLDFQLSLMEQTESKKNMEEIPSLHFLVGICLKDRIIRKRNPEFEEINEIIKLLKEYYINFFWDLILQGAEKDQILETDKLILATRLQRINSQMNPNIYPFQLDDLIANIFGKFDEYFIKKVGFTISDAYSFGQKIIKRYERLLNERIEEVKEAQKKAEQELRDPVKGHELRKIITERNITEKELIRSYSTFIMFISTEEIFLFGLKEFCDEERIEEAEKFDKYLNALSCKFGDGIKNFESPLDENIIISKPIINFNGKYFSPIPQDLIFKLLLIFEKFLEDEKQKQTRIWQQFQNQKAKYTEDKIYEFFSRMFPKMNIHRNMKYTYQEVEFETDLLIEYDNKIIIIESKAGSFTEIIKQNGIKRLRTDLKKLIEEAYQQGKRVVEYIKSNKISTFKDVKSGEEFIIEYRPSGIDFFIINVTFEYMMMLGTNLKDSRSLGLFKEDEYPWSVNLTELDILTRHIPSPTIFIHYLERRLSAQNENIFEAFDELTFFAWYLKVGNFYIPLTEDNTIPTTVLLDASWLEVFDNFYLHGKGSPKLEIEPDFFKIIKTLEILHPIGYSSIASALLDFNHKDRELILENIKKFVGMTTNDGNGHDFTIYNDFIDIGFTFMTQFGRKELGEHLASHCIMKKYQMKAKRWVGIGKDALDDEWFVNEFVYLDSPWKKNSIIDELLEKFPFKSEKES